MLKPLLTAAALAIVAIGAPQTSNAADQDTKIRQLVVEPAGIDKIAGKKKITPFVLKQPQGTTDIADGGQGKPETIVLPIIKQPEGTDVADGGPVEEEPETAKIVKDPEPVDEVADADPVPEVEEVPVEQPKAPVKVRGAKDLYKLLLARGYGVEVLNRDHYGDYTFLVTPTRGAYGYVLLVDGHRGKVLQKRTILLADYGLGGGAVTGHGESYSPAASYDDGDDCEDDYRASYSRRTYIGY